MMINSPSARRLILPTLVLSVFVVISRLLSQQWLPSQDALLQAALQAHMVQQAVQVTLVFQKNNASTSRASSDSPSDSRSFLGTATLIPPANSLITRFQTCTSARVNNNTSHIRLLNELYNITLIPPAMTTEEDAAQSNKEEEETTRFFNPAIIPLPYWSSAGALGGAKYALVSRVVTSGFHQESHICLADICQPAPADPTRNALAPDTRACTAEDVAMLGPRGGMRCTQAPIKLNIPPTPAERCTDAWLAFPDIPGFHDPRVFWSGKGEPLILVNSASRYGCVGLWIVDLRRLFPALADLVAARAPPDGHRSPSGALSSYPHLTEITRNPRSSRAAVEKNWVLWFPTRDDAYVQYDLTGRSIKDEPSPFSRLNGTGTDNTTKSTGTRARTRAGPSRKAGRSFAKLTGNGFTTGNLTHRDEAPCFGAEQEKDALGNQGHWHQGSNALRLIMCTRAEARLGQCDADETVADGRSVHFAIMHRKFSNELDLPLRYERYVAVWESRAPFQMLGVSRWPLLMLNERANPWTEEENWPTAEGEEKAKEKEERGRSWNATMTGPEPGPGIFAGGTGLQHLQGARREQRDGKVKEGGESFNKSRAYFTYTPSLAWAWQPHSAGLGKEEEQDDDVEYMSHLGTGYLGDEVIVGIGMDDVSQAFAKVKVDDLLQCLRLCPGVKVGS